MKKDIKFDIDALNRVTNGVHILAKTVGSTLGPGGRNVIYENYGRPLVTKDGVTVARQIDLVDKYENIGAQMVLQVANNTCDVAGDGTTTATILADAILSEAVKVVSSGVNPIDVQRALLKQSDAVLDWVEKNIKQDADSDEKIKNIALVSSNWDEQIGSSVAEAVLGVGKHGVVQFDENLKSTDMYVKFVEGMNFNNRGFFHPCFINNQTKQTVEYENPKVLLYSGHIKNPREIGPLLNKVAKNNPITHSVIPLVLIAHDFDPDVLSFLYANYVRGTIAIAPMRAPWYSDMREDTLDDLAVYLRTKTFRSHTGDGRNEDGYSISELPLDELGECSKVIMTGGTASFIGGAGLDAVPERIQNLLDLQENNEGLTPEQLGNIDLRVQALKAKVAYVYVGAHSKEELTEKLDRIEDATKSTRAAMEEGVVPGGGYSYIKAANWLSKQKTASEEEKIAQNILINALHRPFEILMSNQGIEKQVSSVMDKIINSKKANWGFDIKQKKMTDLLKDGVIDPFKVTRAALQNAVSVSSLIFTARAVISDNEGGSQVTQAKEPPALF